MASLVADFREWIFTIRARRLLHQMEKELGMHSDECHCQECAVSQAADEYIYVGQVKDL